MVASSLEMGVFVNEFLETSYLLECSANLHNILPQFPLFCYADISVTFLMQFICDSQMRRVGFDGVSLIF